ncbi:hypothetical protein HNY73_015637 [Argiope bruennichi]|uniref:Uncharacterized protein n=1 Tax=Argiope bruennichi TaxID=94029 RepID=A0A8T0ESQ6_ARGBR|nr:hypothetical protein HNY73_015637 [Argiope bruennichi]
MSLLSTRYNALRSVIPPAPPPTNTVLGPLLPGLPYTLQPRESLTHRTGREWMMEPLGPMAAYSPKQPFLNSEVTATARFMTAQVRSFWCHESGSKTRERQFWNRPSERLTLRKMVSENAEPLTRRTQPGKAPKTRMNGSLVQRTM